MKPTANADNINKSQVKKFTDLTILITFLFSILLHFG